MKHSTATPTATRAQIESALDRLALEITAFGDRGRALLPLYAALEDELTALQTADDMMAKVLARVKR